jgi:hypothetical protein
MYHEAEFAISYGLEDRLLRVCRWCKQDLTLLGFNANQIVQLPKPMSRLKIMPLWFLGPVASLMMEAKA